MNSGGRNRNRLNSASRGENQCREHSSILWPGDRRPLLRQHGWFSTRADQRGILHMLRSGRVLTRLPAGIRSLHDDLQPASIAEAARPANKRKLIDVRESLSPFVIESLERLSAKVRGMGDDGVAATGEVMMSAQRGGLSVRAWTATKSLLLYPSVGRCGQCKEKCLPICRLCGEAISVAPLIENADGGFDHGRNVPVPHAMTTS